MTVTLNRAYMGLLSGSTVNLPTNVENALIAQGLASSALAANITPGPYTYNGNGGRAGIPAGSNSVTITNALVDANSKIYATVAQATADTGFVRVERVVPAAGSFTIYGTGNAAATTLVDWGITNNLGLVITNP